MTGAKDPGLARVLHRLFAMSLAIKALLTSAEALTGLGLWLMPNLLVARLVFWLTHFEIAETPHETLATFGQTAIAQFPLATQNHYAVFLMLHGGLKLGMVAMLWARIIWAFPVAIALLAGFVGYQLFEFAHTLSPMLLILAVFDLFMIGLIWQEFIALRAKPHFA